MTPQEIKGYCENRHKEATGMTTAQHTKVLNAAKGKTEAKAAKKATGH